MVANHHYGLWKRSEKDTSKMGVSGVSAGHRICMPSGLSRTIAADGMTLRFQHFPMLTSNGKTAPSTAWTTVMWLLEMN